MDTPVAIMLAVFVGVVIVGGLAWERWQRRWIHVGGRCWIQPSTGDMAVTDSGQVHSFGDRRKTLVGLMASAYARTHSYAELGPTIEAMWQASDDEVDEKIADLLSMAADEASQRQP